MDKFNEQTATPRERRSWEPPALTSVGTIGHVLQGGGGKLSISGGDPGDGRKQSGGSD